jgi:2-methylcitrate dehydratase PrpD
MSSETVRQALKKAFYLGQTYWQQADSEFSSHWKKADATRATFEQLVEDTCNSLEGVEK